MRLGMKALVSTRSVMGRTLPVAMMPGAVSPGM